MTRTLYDPEVYERGRAIGLKEARQEGIKQQKFECAKRLFIKGFSSKDILEITELTIEELESCITERV